MKTKAPAFFRMYRFPQRVNNLIICSSPLLLVLFALSIFIMSCKKDEQALPTQYLRFKLDGVAVECDKNFHANVCCGQPETMLSVAGSYSNIDIELEVNESVSLTTGSYVFAADKLRNATIWINGALHYAGNDGLVYNNLLGSGVITVTELNNDLVKGTFSFTTDSTMLLHPSKYITDGEFQVRLQ